MTDLDFLISQVQEGEAPEEVIKQTLMDVEEEDLELDDIESPLITKLNPKILNQDNTIVLRNKEDSAKVRAALEKAHIRYVDQGFGIFTMEINSRRDGAAQLINSLGISIKSVA